MGEVRIHLYTLSHGFGNSKCGIEYDKLKDHSSQLKWVTCNKCKKNKLIK